jgi:hypothetical protein
MFVYIVELLIEEKMCFVILVDWEYVPPQFVCIAIYGGDAHNLDQRLGSGGRIWGVSPS